MKTNKKKTLDKMVDHLTTLIVRCDDNIDKLNILSETHNKLVEAYNEHGFYNNENPLELYRFLMTNTFRTFKNRQT